MPFGINLMRSQVLYRAAQATVQDVQFATTPPMADNLMSDNAN